MLQETEKPLVTHRVEKASVIGVEYPVHLPSLDANDQRVQGIMLTAPRSESIREPEEVFLVDRIKHGRREISLESKLIFRTISPRKVVGVSRPAVARSRLRGGHEKMSS